MTRQKDKAKEASLPQFGYLASKDEKDGEADKPGALLDIAIELHNEVHSQQCPCEGRQNILCKSRAKTTVRKGAPRSVGLVCSPGQLLCVAISNFSTDTRACLALWRWHFEREHLDVIEVF